MAALTIADALMAQHARQTGVKIAAPERQCISEYEGSIHYEGTWRLRGKTSSIENGLDQCAHKDLKHLENTNEQSPYLNVRYFSL
jgi:hypothetical protein